jgi:hypothetical protein
MSSLPACVPIRVRANSPNRAFAVARWDTGQSVIAHNLVRDGRLAEASPGRVGALRIIGFLSGLFVTDVHCNRIRAGDSDGRAKFLRAGSFRLGDALERYGESRRSATVQLSPPRVVGKEGPTCNDHERHADQYDSKSDMAAIGARSTIAR